MIRKIRKSQKQKLRHYTRTEKLKQKKSVNNETPKLGEEVEYRISFKNTVENGKLAEVKIEDTLPEGVEYVENSLKAEGATKSSRVENGKWEGTGEVSRDYGYRRKKYYF